MLGSSLAGLHVETVLPTVDGVTVAAHAMQRAVGMFAEVVAVAMVVDGRKRRHGTHCDHCDCLSGLSSFETNEKY